MEVKMNYIGEKCFCCNNEFTKDDDVVVCPECGTPYHKQCYKEKGHCINDTLHENGQSWKRTIETDAVNKTAASSENVIICKNCLAKNNPDASVCVNCGKAIKKSDDNSTVDLSEFFSEFDTNQKYFGFNPDEEFDGTRLEEVAEFVNTNTIYYLPLFKKMKELKSKISFNIVCFFFSPFYFANRKMWPMAIFALIVTMLLKLPNAIISLIEGIEATSGSALYDMQIFNELQIEALYAQMVEFFEPYRNLLVNADFICTILSFIFKFIMCLFGNWIYYKFTVKSIKKIKEKNVKVPINTALNSAGGTNTANIIITIFLYCAIYFAFSWILVALFV
ncbi:MAG: DUF2628 domain-containing protein [Ruminococcus sp.]|nr:DUF2628 domain-containing protein [Ruminococcus sp.]